MEFDEEDLDATRRQKVRGLIHVAKFKPRFSIFIILLGSITAIFEAVGLGFIIPVIELVQTENPSEQAGGILGVFVEIYAILGIPFELEYVIAGVVVIMTVRHTASFIVAWFREALRNHYVRDLQTRAFDSALNVQIKYYDEKGSDDIINAIITQTLYAGRVIMRSILFVEQIFLSLAYLLVAFFIAPILSLVSLVFLGGVTLVIHGVVEPGYKLGNTVAEANERRQQAAQAGTQGIRDIRIFDLAEEIFNEFNDAVDTFTEARISLRRNEAAIHNLYNLIVAVSVFLLIYISISFTNLSISEIALFLFAMFQLGPKVSNLNQLYYRIQNELPHLVRTQEFISELNERKETNNELKPIPGTIDTIEFNNVWFSYNGDEPVLKDVSFRSEKGEFISFVGQSGAGKSTIVSLISRFYEYDRGNISANGIEISQFDIEEWRNKITVVRQDPYIFNKSLEYNLTVGSRTVTDSDIQRVCDIAQVTEFLEDLPNGFDTVLGDEGVKLSGGQKQRVAIARALLNSADILIFDEATSDLDSSLEKEVQSAIEEMDQKYILISIAHRLSSIENADRIYTLKNGRVLESGNHSELISANGTYAELYNIQS